MIAIDLLLFLFYTIGEMHIVPSFTPCECHGVSYDGF
uniref:Uncharacterized protein n=1 Tax=Rhizophora mucronata TaxID=61149 RepID=A0A2P2P0B0_RHIMU